MHPDFMPLVRKARITEQYIADYYKLIKGWIVTLNDDYRYDIKLQKNDVIHKLEIKEHPKQMDYKTVLFEFESRGKPSGIITTEADYQIEVFHMTDGIKHYIAKTSVLRNILFEQKLAYDTPTRGGDDKLNLMLRLSLYKYYKYARPMEGLDAYKRSRDELYGKR